MRNESVPVSLGSLYKPVDDLFQLFILWRTNLPVCGTNKGILILILILINAAGLWITLFHKFS